MKLVKGLNYRQWQRRNSLAFKALSKDVQKNLRNQGYHNVGWKKVKKSWELLTKSKVVGFVDYKLKKGDILGAIASVNIESENAKKLANETIFSIQETRQKLDELVKNAVDKYSKI